MAEERKLVKALENLQDSLVQKAQHATEQAQSDTARSWLLALDQAQRCLEVEYQRERRERFPRCCW